MWQMNKMLRGSEEVEYEVFISADAADGLLEDWKQLMHPARASLVARLPALAEERNV